MPDLIIIAGPNGAGKSTIFPALQNTGPIEGAFQPNTIKNDNWVNPDNIAKDQNLDKLDAGRAAIQKINKHIENKEDFAIETTLSGKSLLLKIKQARDCGYRIFIIYISLDSYELSACRVIQRALLGKHYIPLDIIIQRFKKSLDNMVNKFIPLSDFWVVVDNSDLPNPLCWGGKIYEDNKLYSNNENSINKFIGLLNANKIIYLKPSTNYYDVFSQKVFSKINEQVIEEIKRRPTGNYVVVQRNGRIQFVSEEKINEAVYMLRDQTL